MSAELYTVPVRRADGTEESLAGYEGKVVLIVNTASKCGLTPQYEGLEKVYETYRDRGFVVLGFPANEFGGQEPGSDDEIQEFCQVNFNVKFPVYGKIVVKGEGQHPLYRYLTDAQPTAQAGPDSTLRADLEKFAPITGKPNDILWNFEKFLVNRHGAVVARFAPDVKPDDPLITQAIEAELARD